MLGFEIRFFSSFFAQVNIDCHNKLSIKLELRSILVFVIIYIKCKQSSFQTNILLNTHVCVIVL